MTVEPESLNASPISKMAATVLTALPSLETNGSDVDTCTLNTPSSKRLASGRLLSSVITDTNLTSNVAG